MSNGIRCPECGGDQVRQITPGYYECTAQIAVGGIPPSLTGLSHPITDIQPCGARFQFGAPVATSSCALCGLDSIGTCEGCRRRLCGNHGTASPPFLCRECLDRKTAEQSRAQAAARAEKETAAASRHSDRLARILASTDREEIAQLLTGDLSDFTLEEGKQIWASLLALDQIPPTHEMVTMKGRMTVIGFFASGNGARTQPGSWKEIGERENLWFAQGAARKFSKGFDGYSDSWSEGLDAVLDASGRLQLTGKGWRLLFGGPRGVTHFVLPKGREIDLTREKGAWRVQDAYSAYPYTAHEDALSLVSAIAAVAQSVSLGSSTS